MPADDSAFAEPVLITETQAAELLGLGPTGMARLLRDGTLVAVPDAAGRRAIPADFLQDGEVVKHLTATITLLRDGRYSDPEIVEWLFRPDGSLPGTPIQALRDNRGTEVKRRAQAAGF